MFTGGLRVSGIAGVVVNNPDATTFDQVIASPLTGAAVIRDSDINYGTGTPPGIGLSSADLITVVVEGEIELDAAGTWRIELNANDAGFLDIAAPGAGFTRLISSTNANAIASIDVPQPGWYRIRGAFSDSGGSMQWDLQVDSPAIPGSAFRDLGSDHMRARVDDLPGVVIDGFDEPFDILYGGSVRVDVLDQSFAGNPFGLPLGSGSYTVRSSGQLLIDTDGDYVFQIDSVQGHRMWLDGIEIADKLGSTNSTSTTTNAIHLVSGWHDLVIDVGRRGGSGTSRLALSIVSGPTTGSIPSDHLRPVVGRAERFATRSSTTPVAIPDNGSASRTITIDEPVGFVADRIDLQVDLAHADVSTLSLVVNPPSGSDFTLAGAGSLSGTSATLTDNPTIGHAGSSWQFTATDTVADAVTGTIEFAGVTMLGTGGVAPFATAYRYESAIHDLGPDVTQLDGMTWALRQASDPAVAAMQIRTCDDAAGCAAEPWTDVALGTVPGVPARRFAQYGVTITTNGDIPVALDSVELNYTTTTTTGP